LHRHSTKLILQERDPGRIVLVRAEADKESPFEGKSRITFTRNYCPIRENPVQAAETKLRLGLQGSLGWNKIAEKPIGTLRAKSKLTGMDRVHCNKSLQRILRRRT